MKKQIRLDAKAGPFLSSQSSATIRLRRIRCSMPKCGISLTSKCYDTLNLDPFCVPVTWRRHGCLGRGKYLG